MEQHSRKLFVVPGLDDIARDFRCLSEVNGTVLAALGTSAAAVSSAISNENLRRAVQASDSPHAEGSDDRLLTADEAAALLGLTPAQVKRRASGYSFTRKLGHRTLRFSEAALRRWIERKRAA